MLTIRLTRKGKKNQPFFRVVVIDKRRSSKGGRAVEVLGYIDPLTKRRSLEKERVLYWISKGAKTSATIHNLLISEKIIEGKKITKFNISKKKQAELAKAKADTSAKAVASEEKSTEKPKPETLAEILKEEPKSEELKPEEPKPPEIPVQSPLDIKAGGSAEPKIETPPTSTEVSASDKSSAGQAGEAKPEELKPETPA